MCPNCSKWRFYLREAICEASAGIFGSCTKSCASFDSTKKKKKEKNLEWMRRHCPSCSWNLSWPVHLEEKKCTLPWLTSFEAEMAATALCDFPIEWLWLCDQTVTSFAAPQFDQKAVLFPFSSWFPEYAQDISVMLYPSLLLHCWDVAYNYVHRATFIAPVNHVKLSNPSHAFQDLELSCLLCCQNLVPLHPSPVGSYFSQSYLT